MGCLSACFGGGGKYARADVAKVAGDAAPGGAAGASVGSPQAGPLHLREARLLASLVICSPRHRVPFHSIN